jgi:hypothetical protein
MFNLNEDPYELVNLAHNNKFRAERQKLIARLGNGSLTPGTNSRYPRIRKAA